MSIYPTGSQYFRTEVVHTPQHYLTALAAGGNDSRTWSTLMAGERSFISTPGRLQIARAASYITMSDRWRRELSRNCEKKMAIRSTMFFDCGLYLEAVIFL